MVRYYGYYSNVSRGKRQKEAQDNLIPSILEPDGSSKEYRKNWARLIKKIYEVDPLTCPKCQGRMLRVAFIEDEEVIKKILMHLGLWELKARPPPKTTGKTQYYHLDDSTSQLSPSDEWLYVDTGLPVRDRTQTGIRGPARSTWRRSTGQPDF